MGNDPQRYAENLANQAFEALIKHGAKAAPFIFSAYDDTTVAVLPVISHDKETVQLWGVLQSHHTPKRR